jgi:hypothetical protein
MIFNAYNQLLKKRFRDVENMSTNGPLFLLRRVKDARELRSSTGLQFHTDD